MKLQFLFIVIDVLTLLVYPMVYVDGKLRQFSKSKENILRFTFTNSVTSVR